MVLEVGLIDVKADSAAAGSSDGFRAAYAEAKQHLAGAEGLLSIRMTQGLETPTRFVLLVEWADLAAHEAFRTTDAFTAWRRLLGPHFAAMPHVEHFEDV